MQKIVIVSGIFFIIIITSFISGCTLQDPRDNPKYSVFPEVLIDYDFDSKETKIWVKSALSDFKYDSIIFQISSSQGQEIIQDNNTYCLPTSTELTSFNLTVKVISDENDFEFDSRIEIEETGENLIIMTIYDYDENSMELIDKNDLPYKKVL